MSAGGETDRGANGRLDFICGAVMAAVSLALFFWFIPTFAPGDGGRGQISPSFFPRMAVVVVFFCALLVMAGNVRALSQPGTGAGAQLVVEIVCWTVFALALFALLAWAGFVAGGIFAVLAGVLLTRYRRHPILIAIIAIGLPVLLKWAVWTMFWIELP